MTIIFSCDRAPIFFRVTKTVIMPHLTREAVQHKLNSITNAMETKNIKEISERYDVNAKLMPSHEVQVSGQKDIHAWYGDRINHEGKDFHLKYEAQDIDDFDNIVVVAGRFTAIHNHEENGHGKFLIVLERHDKDDKHKYKIHYHMWNSNEHPHEHSEDHHATSH